MKASHKHLSSFGLYNYRNAASRELDTINFQFLNAFIFPYAFVAISRPNNQWKALPKKYSLLLKAICLVLVVYLQKGFPILGVKKMTRTHHSALLYIHDMVYFKFSGVMHSHAVILTMHILHLHSLIFFNIYICENFLFVCSTILGAVLPRCLLLKKNFTLWYYS